LAALEGAGCRHDIESFYRHVVSTVGVEIVPAIVERIRANPDAEEYDDIPRSAVKTLIQIGQRFPEEVGRIAVGMLNDTVATVRLAGTRILAKVPCGAAVSRLWELHVESSNSAEDERNRYDRDAPYAALRACVSSEAPWLRQAIRRNEHFQELLKDLVWLLNEVEGTTGSDVWHDEKTSLIGRLSKSAPGCLIACISRFGDLSELDRLEGWARGGGLWVAGPAFAAIIHLDLDRALRLFAEIDISRMHGWSWSWRPLLFAKAPNRARDVLLERIRRVGDDFWALALLYENSEDDMDVSTLDSLLAVIAEDVAAIREEPAAGDLRRSSRILEVVAAVHRPELLAHLRSLAGSQFEDDLATVGVARSTGSGREFDHELRHIETLLLKIAGRGISRVNNAQIHSDACYEAFDSAMVAPDEETVRRLVAITERPELSGSPPHPDSQQLATKALAAIGEDTAVIRSVLRWGDAVTWKVQALRAHRPPMTDSSISAAIQGLSASNEQVRERALIALGVSGREDLIPSIREFLSSDPSHRGTSRAAADALLNLGDASPELVAFLSLELQDKERKYFAVNGLLQVGSDEALDALERHLTEGDPAALEDFELFAIDILARKRPTFALKQVPALIERGTRDEFRHTPFSVFAQVDGIDSREALWEAVALEERMVRLHGQRASALKALASLSPEDATEAARAAWERDTWDKADLPQLLLKFDPDGAVSFLCEQIVNEKRTAVRWAIGRDLRAAANRGELEERIRALLNDVEPARRQAGVEICGWLVSFLTEELQERLNDRDPEVRKEAVTALRRRRDEQTVGSLFAEFNDVAGVAQWATLHAIVDVADPELLGTREDPLWIGRILRDQPYAMQRFASSAIERRSKELKKIAEDLDRKRSR
jgi:hypothetical protein